MRTIRARKASHFSRWSAVIKGMPLRRRSKWGVDHSPEGRAKRTVDGILFHSLKEARHWQTLQQWQRAGLITDLRRQVPYDLYAASGEVIAQYVADMTYRRWDKALGAYEAAVTVVDVKGARTPMYTLKRKWLAAQGVFVQEV